MLRSGDPRQRCLELARSRSYVIAPTGYVAKDLHKQARKAIKAHLLADLDQSYKANRERYEVCLEELRLRTRAHIEGLRGTREKLSLTTSMQTKH